MDMRAKKRFKYRGKVLKPGAPLTATRSRGRVLEAIGYAEEVQGGTYAAPQPKRSTKRVDPLDHDRDGKRGGSTTPGPSPELQAAREEYKRVTGKNFFSLWDIEELKARQARHVAENDPGDTSPEG